MDKYVDTDVGIYHIEYECDKRDHDGHKLYHVKCRYCKYEGDMRLFNIKQATICKHTDRMGNLIEFQPHWSCRRLRKIFKGMQDRCFNSNHKDYRWYGAKGVNICEEWLNNPKAFEEWAINNGYSDNLTIDRINPNGDYAPDNCRWILQEENARRAGKVNWLTVDDITLTGSQWAQKLQIGINVINSTIRNYGVDKTKELIMAMLKEPVSTKQRKPTQSWLSVYGIQV